jgi:Ca2+-binding EF-hand superfamily protein
MCDAEVQEVFSFFDKDADGCVTIDNLGPLIRSIGYNPSESDLRFLTTNLKNEG